MPKSKRSEEKRTKKIPDVIFNCQRDWDLELRLLAEASKPVELKVQIEDLNVSVDDFLKYIDFLYYAHSVDLAKEKHYITMTCHTLVNRCTMRISEVITIKKAVEDVLMYLEANYE